MAVRVWRRGEARAACLSESDADARRGRCDESVDASTASFGSVAEKVSSVRVTAAGTDSVVGGTATCASESQGGADDPPLRRVSPTAASRQALKSCTVAGRPRPSPFTPSAVTLASGATAPAGLPPIGSHAMATAISKITDVGVFSPSSCDHAAAAGLRVYPPGQTTSSVVSYPFVACSRTGSVSLHMEAVQTGIRHG